MAYFKTVLLVEMLCSTGLPMLLCPQQLFPVTLGNPSRSFNMLYFFRNIEKNVSVMTSCLQRNVHGYENKILLGDAKRKKKRKRKAEMAHTLSTFLYFSLSGMKTSKLTNIQQTMT